MKRIGLNPNVDAIQLWKNGIMLTLVTRAEAEDLLVRKEAVLIGGGAAVEVKPTPVPCETHRGYHNRLKTWNA